MTNELKLSVVIPAYKEAENLAVILPRITEVLKTVEPSYEILIIDTLEQMDNTKNICGSIIGNVRYIKREISNTYGSAIRTGLKYAVGEFVIFMDADGSHTPEFIENIYKEKNNANVVIASRYVDGGNTENNIILILMSRLINIIYSKVLKLDCKDVSNSFKLYKNEDLKKLSLNCNNFDVVEEILFKLKKLNKNIVIKEIPHTFKERVYGKTKRNLFLFMVTYVITLIKLRFGK